MVQRYLVEVLILKYLQRYVLGILSEGISNERCTTALNTLNWLGFSDITLDSALMSHQLMIP